MKTIFLILLFLSLTKTQPLPVKIVKIAGNPSDSWNQFFNTGKCDTILNTYNYVYKTKTDIVCYKHSGRIIYDTIINLKNDTIIIENIQGLEKRYSLLIYRIIAILQPFFGN